MTRMEKAIIGSECHKTLACKKCPYYEDDRMLDPRIDPNYSSNLLEHVKRCRDKLIKDITEIYIDR